MGAFFQGGSESYGLPTKSGSRAWLFGPGDDQRIAAHCSNFSPRRVELWDRATAWELSLARRS